jgi:hypothetical protein
VQVRLALIVTVAMVVLAGQASAARTPASSTAGRCLKVPRLAGGRDHVTDEPYAICEGCRERSDPDARGTVEAVEMVRTEAGGPTIEYVEGEGVYFHEHCFPDWSSRYRRKGVSP